MMMDWMTIIFALLLVLSMAVSVILALVTRRKKDAPGADYFVIMVLGIAVWSLAYALEILSPDLATKVFWAKFQYIGIAIIPVGWLFFSFTYSSNESKIEGDKKIPFLIIPLITILLAFTNEFHGLIWREYELSGGAGLTTMSVQEYGLWWWISFIYAYSILIWGSLVLAKFMFSRRGAFRWQFNLILISLILPWVANLLYLINIRPIPSLDLSPIAFTISAVLLGVAIYRFRLFDLIPVARQPMIHQMDSVAIILDPRDRIIDLNNAALSLLGGYQEGESIEQVFEWWAEVAERNEVKLETNHDVPVVLDGLRRYYNLQITPIWNRRRNAVIARLVILRDITGDKLVGEAIALAQVKTEFLAKVGHELRSPLTSILGMAEMLDYGVYGPLTEKQLEAVRMISDSTQHMTRMVNDLLQQSKLERGIFKMDISEFPLSDLLNQVIDHARPMARVKGLKLYSEFTPDVPERIRGDSLRLYQIIVNLLDNAIKYTLEGEIILKVFMADNEHIAYQVSDTGVGIPKELQRLIFYPFHQADSISPQKESGFGLGLSIVKQLTSLMDGKIKMESEVGKGSVFTVILPKEPVWNRDP